MPRRSKRKRSRRRGRKSRRRRRTRRRTRRRQKRGRGTVPPADLGLYKGGRVKFTASFLTHFPSSKVAKFKKYRGTITDISGDWANPTILVQWDRAKKINTHRIYQIEAAADLPQPKRPKSAMKKH